MKGSIGSQKLTFRGYNARILSFCMLLPRRSKLLVPTWSLASNLIIIDHEKCL
jgi:hypothetical protein